MNQWWNKINSGNTFLIIAGPCVLEEEPIVFSIADQLKHISQLLDLDIVFKGSFDKANRTSIKSYRGPGLDRGLELLRSVKEKYNLKITTDVHLPSQVDKVAKIVDIIQIPAFLCRQTDLLLAAGHSGKIVNVKKGQFISPDDTGYIVEKINSTGNQKVLLTERGSCFGYHNLIVDFTSLPKMKKYAPVIFDATHSVQKPGAKAGQSGGERNMIEYLSRAAAAVGVNGLFFEVHPHPEKALSDRENSLNIKKLLPLLKMLLRIRQSVINQTGEK